MKIKNFSRKKNKTLIIAEIGINHNGNLNLCKKMIIAAGKAGADAVKLQSINPDNSYMENTSSYKIFKNKNFSFKQLIKIQNLCKKNNLIFFTTPGDIETLNDIKKLNLDIYKISSGLFNNIPLILEILKLNKPLILSTGMAKKTEIDLIYKIVKKKLGNNFAILKCTANYPCSDKNVNLNGIPFLLKNYKCEIGYSDHTKDDLAAISAVSLGATIIEKHFTIDQSLPGGDNHMSMIPKDFKIMVNKIRRVEDILGSGHLSPTKSEQKERNLRYRFLVSKKFINKGDKINIDNINMKRVDNFNKSFIPAIDFLKLNNKKLKKKVPPNIILKKSMF